MTNEQLELGLNGAKPLCKPGQRQGRMARAAWWFGQMRQVVDRALDWQSVPSGRPEQTWLVRSRSQGRA